MRNEDSITGILYDFYKDNGPDNKEVAGLIEDLEGVLERLIAQERLTGSESEVFKSYIDMIIDACSAQAFKAGMKTGSKLAMELMTEEEDSLPSKEMQQ